MRECAKPLMRMSVFISPILVWLIGSASSAQERIRILWVARSTTEHLQIPWLERNCNWRIYFWAPIGPEVGEEVLHYVDKPVEATPEMREAVEKYMRQKLEAHLQRLSEFDAVLLTLPPERLTSDEQRRLLDYVKGGGSLITLNLRSAGNHPLSEALPVSIETTQGTIPHHGWFFTLPSPSKELLALWGIPTDWLQFSQWVPKVKPHQEAQSLTSQPAGVQDGVFVRQFGKGKVVFVPFPSPLTTHHNQTFISSHYDMDEITLRFWERVLVWLKQGEKVSPVWLDVSLPTPFTATRLAFIPKAKLHRFWGFGY